MSQISVGAAPGAAIAVADSVEEKAPAAAWYAFWTLCAVTLLRMVDQVVLTVGTEQMRKSLDLSDVQLGMLQGFGMSLAAAIGVIPLAWLADRFDRRKVLAICVFAWSAATVWRAYVMSFPELMASTVGMAVAEAALGPVVFALLPVLFRGRQLSRVNLLYYGASAFGSAMAMMFVGAVFKVLETHRDSLPFLIRGMESWRSASFVVGCIGPLFCLMVLRIRAQGRAPRAMKSSPTVGLPIGLTALSLRAYLREHWRALAGIYGSTMLLTLGLGPLLVWIAPAVARRFGMDPSEVGTQVGALLFSAMVGGMVLAGVFQRHLGKAHGILVPMRTAPTLTALTVLPLVGLGIVESRFGIYACVLLAMVTLIAYNASMPTVYQKIVPAALRARVIAIALSAVTAVSALGPVLVGHISDRLHSDNSLLLSVALIGAPTTAAAALVLWWARKHVKAAVDYCEKVDGDGAAQ